MVVYNAETELVKNIFLLFMNLVEWLSFLFNIIVYWYELYQSHINCTDLKIPCFVTATEMSFDSYLFSSYLFVGDNLIILGLVLIACLCEYLAARYSQVSWIKSTNEIQFFAILWCTWQLPNSFPCSVPL